MNFHDFYFGLSPSGRSKYADAVGTSIYYLEQVAGGFKLPSLRMATRLVRNAPRRLSIEAIIKTFEEKNGSLT